MRERPVPAGNRRQWRTTIRLRTDGPDFSVTLFSPYKNLADRHEAEFGAGSRALFTGKAKQFRGSWQLEQAHGFALDGEGGAVLSKLIPVYPLTASSTPGTSRRSSRRRSTWSPA